VECILGGKCETANKKSRKSLKQTEETEKINGKLKLHCKKG
jgi:hypothetical protein